jgi:hypothetical protein
VTVSKVMPAYVNYGKTTLEKRNSMWKSTLAERDRHTLRRIVKKITELLQQNWIFILKTLFPQNCLTWPSQIQHPR